MLNHRSRFVVPGDNLKWAKYIADASEVQPWGEMPANVKNVYWTQVGQYLDEANDKTPVGITLQNGVVPSIYILTNGVEFAGSVLAIGTCPSVFGTVTTEPAAVNGVYEKGAPVKVKFTPAADVTFVCWEGDIGVDVKSNAEVTVAANGVISLKPRFKANFLAYDKDEGILTDGQWKLDASGEKDAIRVWAFKGANFTTGVADYGPVYEAFDLDLSKSVRTADGAGKIVEFTTRLLGAGCTYASRLILPNTLEKMGNNMFQSATIPIEPKMPESMTSIGSALFADTNNKNINGNFRVGFATDANGDYLTTYLDHDAFTRGGAYMGPKVEFGPGIKELTSNTFHEDNFAKQYEGPIEIWFGPNLSKAAEGAMGTSVGGTNAVSFYFQGDMFSSTSKMFSKTTTEKSGYRYRFYVGAEGCKKWQEFLANTEYVTPWAKLDSTVQAEYRKHFAKGTPYGLTTAAAALSDGSGLPEAVWVFSLKPTGMCIRIQ